MYSMQFERSVFGEMSTPSRANYVMRKNAEENGADLPLGVKAIKTKIGTGKVSWIYAPSEMNSANDIFVGYPQVSWSVGTDT